MTVAVLPGDGIGPEVVEQAVRVLRALRPDVECIEGTVGAHAIREGMPPFPDEVRSLCDRADAILFGSVGDAEFDDEPFERRPEAVLFALRHDYGLFANLRPVRTDRVDFVVVRELTGGIYFGKPKERGVNEDGTRWAVDTMFYSAPEIERIARVAFTLARSRKRHVTSVDKHNILATSRLWREVVNEVATSYPDVSLEHLLVDNAAMQLLRRSGDFDVILTENMFGDILSDEAAMLAGSIGNLPSASLGAGEPGKTFGMYEPISGTAPDIAGKHVANPTGAILSAALMLRYSLNDEMAAQRIEAALEEVFADGIRTRDLAPAGGGLGTHEFADQLLQRLGVPV